MRAARSIVKRRVLPALAALGAVLVPASALPCDSTCCLMLTRGASGLVGRGAFQVDLSFRHTDVSTRLEGTGPTDTVVRPKVYLEEGEIIPGYDEDRTGSESFFQVDAAWGVAASTTVFASWPLSVHRNYVIGHGETETTYNVHGLGDLVVGARQALVRRPGRVLVVSLGVELPTGSNERIDSFDATLLDPTLQPGTGSGDVITALQWSTLGPGRTEVAVLLMGRSLVAVGRGSFTVLSVVYLAHMAKGLSAYGYFESAQSAGKVVVTALVIPFFFAYRSTFFSHRGFPDRDRYGLLRI